jgi:hypothetical protein
VRDAALDLKSVVNADKGLALEEASEGLDFFLGPMGEVGEGFLDDASALALALAEEDGGWGVPVGDRLDVHGNYYITVVKCYKNGMNINMGTL